MKNVYGTIHFIQGISSVFLLHRSGRTYYGLCAVIDVPLANVMRQ